MDITIVYVALELHEDVMVFGLFCGMLLFLLGFFVRRNRMGLWVFDIEVRVGSPEIIKSVFLDLVKSQFLFCSFQEKNNYMEFSVNYHHTHYLNKCVIFKVRISKF